MSEQTWTKLVTMAILLLILYAVAGWTDWLRQPSKWDKAETEYTECLKVVLNAPTRDKDIGAAHALCGDRKK